MRVRFSSVLVVALLGLLLSTATLIAGTSYVNARRNAETLSTEVLGQAVDRVTQRVRTQVDAAVVESVRTQRMLSRTASAPPSRDELAHYFVDGLTAEHGVAYLSFGYEATGELVQARRRQDEHLEVRYLIRKPDGALELSDFLVKVDSLQLLARDADKRENEPRSRSYYVAAKTAGVPVWTDSYSFFGAAGEADRPGITHATPVYRADGTLLGVATADFDLGALSKFLGTLDVLEHGLAFVIEERRDGSRRVVAHPDATTLTRPSAAAAGSSAGREVVVADQSSDARVVAMVKSLPQTLRADADAPAQSTFSLGDTNYIGGYRLLTDGNLSWIVCVVFPEDDILGPVRRSNRQTVIIVVVGIAAAVILALLLGGVLSRPLRRLADETEAIGRLELESRDVVHSRLLEVERLSSSMEQMKRGLRSFRKFVPAELVHELLKSGREAQVGGERRRLTIHFSDIAGFTSIAETMPPEELVAFLGDYLEAMTEPIHRSGGTVDKYIGDAIMAFWGAPREDAEHALHACDAALENRARLERLNVRWEAEGRPRFDARAALHTGDVIVGNVGSGSKLDYTVIGDAVNLASRLEGLNKRYGTRLMISEDTWSLVRDVMIARPLDRVSVKGKSKSVEVYELIGRIADVSKEDAEAAKSHAEAFAMYLARRWGEAAQKLEQNLASRPDDEAAKVLLARCRDLMAHPPEDDWDGSEKMTTK